jgi:hypothetical protein
MIELKQEAPLGDDPSADLPPAFPREGAKQLLDNDRVRVWDYAFTPHRVGPLHRHVRDAVAVWLEGGKLKTTPRDGASTEGALAPSVRSNATPATCDHKPFISSG